MSLKDNIKQIIIKTVGQFKKIMKSKEYNDYDIDFFDHKLMISGPEIVKRGNNPDNPPKGPSKPPRWFVDFANEQREVNKQQAAFNQEMLTFVKEQRVFNQQVITRLDRIETRLDKVEARLDKVEVRLDKVEARLNNVEGVLSRNNLK